MKKRIFVFVTICLATFERNAIASKKPWTSEFAIERAVLAPLRASTAFPRASSVLIAEAPGQEHFCIVRALSSLQDDTNIAEILIFNKRSVYEHLNAGETGFVKPIQVFREISSGTLGELAPVRSLSWDSPSTIVYLAAHQRGSRLIRANIRTAEKHVIAETAFPIVSFRVSGDGVIWECIKGTSGVGKLITDLDKHPTGAFLPSNLRFWSLPTRQYFTRYGGCPPIGIRDIETVSFFGSDPFELSPDGRFAVVTSKVGNDATHGKGLALITPQYKFSLIDCRSGNRILLTAPIGVETEIGRKLADKRSNGVRPRALWNYSGDLVALVTTMVSCSRSDGSRNLLSDDEMAYVACLDPNTNVLDTMGPLCTDDGALLREVDWLEQRSLAMKYERQDRQYFWVINERINGTWISRRTTTNPFTLRMPKADALQIYVRESANEPQLVIGKLVERQAIIYDPEPRMHEMKIAAHRPFGWISGGKQRSGGLWLPDDFIPGKLIPLVIQTYINCPTRFLPDGPIRGNGDATQALVANGIAVLQIETITDAPGILEGSEFVAIVDDAVDALEQCGIADRKRVGVTGFSRMGYRVLYTITHPGRTKLAAAVCVDSYTGSYSSYLSYIALGSGAVLNSDGTPNIEKVMPVNGGLFWRNKIGWLKQETTFNVDAVQTPCLYSHHFAGAPEEVISALSLIGAFVGNQKPLENLVFPHGDHQLQRPRERLLLMNTVVAWMSFWLKGETPDDVMMADRWQVLKAMINK